MKFESVTYTLLTPPGRSAIATICVSGEPAVDLVSRLFTPLGTNQLVAVPLRKIVYGHWGHADGEGVVVARLNHHTLEIHCHGGVIAAAAIIADLSSHGASEKSPEAHLRDSTDHTTSHEARLMLAQAKTERCALILLDQLQGALSNHCQTISQDLANGHMERARQSILALIDTWPLGNHLVNPWKVVLAGPPNVGKSSLINALVGFQRSIVFDQPGTTRDVVSVQTAMDGWPIELSDTAGIRSATDAIEAEGVERAQAQLASADLVILVTDPDQAADRLEDLLLPDVTKVIRVWNKSDLHAAPSGEFLATSTLEQTGVAELLEAIVGRLVSKVPAAGDAVVFTQRQYDILLTTLSRLDDLSTSQDATPCIEKLAELTSLAR